MNQNPYFSLLRIAWQYARHEKKRFVLVYAMFIVANIIFSLNPLLYGWFVDKIQKEGIDVLKHAWLYAGGYLLLRLSEWAFHGTARVMERELAFNLSRNFLHELYHQTLHLPVKWHQDNHSGATINRIRKAYEALKTFFQDGFMYLHAFSKFIFSFIAMLYFSPVFGGVGVLLGLFTIWIITKFDKPFIKALDETNEREHVVSSTLFDSLSNIITVITLRLESRMEDSLSGKIAHVFKPFKKQVILNEWKWFVADMLVATIYVVITVGFVFQNWSGDKVFFVGGLVTLLGYVNNFTSVFHDVAWLYTQIIQHNTDVQTARTISAAYHEQHRLESNTVLPENWKEIEISGLNFSHQETYDATSKGQALHNLSIRIKKGQKIAFIGESGSGKSTLLALLRGLYVPEKGVMLDIDGQNMPDELAILSETVTLFPQEPEIFENSIEYNITLGLPFEKDEILQVCNTAHFSDVIQQLPKGLESNIQEKGVNLSGGQKQRLALARGVLAARSSDIVLLDEPTSSVDPKTEMQIYQKLFQEFREKAVLSTLHRLHLLVHFDYVYILQNGNLADEGTFQYLKENSPVFQELWKHQKDAVKKEFEDKG
ncbi:ABC-type multidrug transport system, ATPase and permease component [Pseudarcicella hirudinis]|uniref:ABC-type multidrug transport system, ATPase and permease component n=1 Tax=Pseudarcicella hirudinis TaxID=1079859 RepID=A0A1I5NUH2_9BACT|nr:ABC transporter ATP-binding protein [Pseudarcicella hirudinis]SFP25413.1 ABC-type multidrug transport system, ATPase and permease component [Pseudarcicella hirudinis]